MIGPALGVAGGVANIIGAGKANKRLKRLQGDDPSYQVSPLAGERLGLAQQLLNARMPGAASVERNIYGNQANAQANIERNATSGSQALALGMASQAQTSQSFQELGQQEAQDYYNRLQNLSGAQQGMIGEQDKFFQDKVRRWENRAQIEGAQTQNTANMWNTVSNMGNALAASGGIGGDAGEKIASMFFGMSGGMKPKTGK